MAVPDYIRGNVPCDGSCRLRARVVDDAEAILAAGDLASASYTIEQLDDADPDAGTAVAGHEDVELDVGELLHALQAWTEDDVGYNLSHVLDVSEAPAFATRGVWYRLVFRLVPTTGQAILVRFKLYAT